MNTYGPPDPPIPRDRQPDPDTPADSSDVVDLLLQIRARVARIEEVVTERQRVRDHYSTAEVAEILGKAEFTVREWCRLGRVRAGKKHSGRGKHPAWVISDTELKRIQREGLLPA
jgi:hypothetical protein